MTGHLAKYMQAIKSNDKDFTAHYNLGNALYKSKKYEEAKAEFQKAQRFSQNLPISLRRCTILEMPICR